MGFKLFKSAQDKMTETLFRLTLPTGKDIRQLLDSGTDYFMGDYYSTKMYERPLQELLFLKSRLKSLGVGLAICEDAGVFYADTAQVWRFSTSLLKTMDNNGDSIVTLLLIKQFWTNKIPIANVRVFMEGFEIETFVDGQKVKKELLRKPI